MPRNMSFMLTTQQVRDRTKTVTRRLGWWFLKPGDIVMACEKCRGLKRGEHVKRIAPIRIVNSRPSILRDIRPADVRREGFPEMTPYLFVAMFCREMGCTPGQTVNRIEFEYV